MARFRNTRTGVVVSVDDDTATRLGGAYEPVEGKPAPKKAPAKKSAVNKKPDEE